MLDQHGALMRDILLRLDIEAFRRLWGHVSAHLVQPQNEFQALAMMHNARTQAASIDLRRRAYSHQWLIANNLPSMLPNDLKPKAEQIDFRFVYGVGLAVKTISKDPERAIIAKELRAAMAGAAEEAVHEGRLDTEFLRARMADARAKRLRELGRPKVNVRTGYAAINLTYRSNAH